MTTSEPMPGGGEPPATVPVELAAAWEQGEAHLFQQILVRPDGYQRAVLVVAALAERLRELGSSIDVLVTASATAPELVVEVATERNLSLAGLHPVLVGQAALAMRHREVLAEQALRRRRDRLAAAREVGRAWEVLEERGDPQGDPFRPYARLEAHPATGRALVVAAQPDDQFRRSVHTVRTARLDLATADLLDVDETDPIEWPDASAREREVERLKAVAEGS